MGEPPCSAEESQRVDLAQDSKGILRKLERGEPVEDRWQVFDSEVERRESLIANGLCWQCNEKLGDGVGRCLDCSNDEDWHRSMYRGSSGVNPIFVMEKERESVLERATKNIQFYTNTRCRLDSEIVEERVVAVTRQGPPAPKPVAKKPKKHQGGHNSRYDLIVEEVVPQCRWNERLVEQEKLKEGLPPSPLGCDWVVQRVTPEAWEARMRLEGMIGGELTAGPLQGNGTFVSCYQREIAGAGQLEAEGLRHKIGWIERNRDGVLNLITYGE